jgi:hypothetical protein
MSTLRSIQKDLLLYFSEKGGDATPFKDIDPHVWGSHAWKFLDSIIDAYPQVAKPKDKVMMVQFILSLGHVLPCSKCRKNFQDFTRKLPPTKHVGGRKQLSKWFKAYKRHI